MKQHTTLTQARPKRYISMFLYLLLFLLLPTRRLFGVCFGSGGGGCGEAAGRQGVQINSIFIADNCEIQTKTCHRWILCWHWRDLLAIRKRFVVCTFDIGFHVFPFNLHVVLFIYINTYVCIYICINGVSLIYCVLAGFSISIWSAKNDCNVWIVVLKKVLFPLIEIKATATRNEETIAKSTHTHTTQIHKARSKR